MDTTRHIGLFGGSFNPPHQGHLLIAEVIRDQFALDAVWWMPNHTAPHKEIAGAATPDDRLAMVRLAIADHPHFDVSEAEVRRGGTSYMVDTLEDLQAMHPHTRFSLILGGDSVRSFMSWHRPRDILRLVDLLVYDRGDLGLDDVPAEVRTRMRTARAPRLDVSSTAIRARVRNEQSIRYWTPDPVAAYLKAHALYQSDEAS